MKKLALTILLFAASAAAQLGNPGVVAVPSTPTSCSTLPLKVVQNSANLYGANGSGGCAAIGGGGGSGTVSGQAANVIGKATNATTTGAQSALSDDGTTVTSTEPVSAPTLTAGTSVSIAGGTPMTSQSSAQPQIVTCAAGGTSTQYCGADGAWHTPSAGTPAYNIGAAYALSTTTPTVALTNGAVQTLTLSGNTTIAFTQPSGYVGKVTLILTQAAGGNDTVTWTSVKWPSGIAPVMTATASAIDLYSCILDGTYTYCTAGQSFQ